MVTYDCGCKDVVITEGIFGEIYAGISLFHVRFLYFDIYGYIKAFSVLLQNLPGIRYAAMIVKNITRQNYPRTTMMYRRNLG